MRYFSLDKTSGLTIPRTISLKSTAKKPTSDCDIVKKPSGKKTGHCKS